MQAVVLLQIIIVIVLILFISSMVLWKWDIINRDRIISQLKQLISIPDTHKIKIEIDGEDVVIGYAFTENIAKQLNSLLSSGCFKTSEKKYG